MKIYVILKDLRENNKSPILIVTKNKAKAICVCEQYLRDNNIGEDLFWKSSDEFDKDLVEMGKKQFIDHFMNLWLITPHWREEKLE